MGLLIEGMTSLVEDMSVMLTKMESNAILEEGAQPLLEQMQQNASSNPKQISGKLHNALGVKAHASGTITVGVHRSDWSDEEYYPAYVEFGHGGPHPAPAHPFVRPAVDAKGNEALDNIKEKLRQALS